MLKRSTRWTRQELIESLDTTWSAYPHGLQQRPEDEQVRFAQQQGYAHPQDLLAHLGAWMEESLRVMPYLQRNEKPPRDYTDDDEFNLHAVQRFANRSWSEVEMWYEQQRVALRRLIEQLSDEEFQHPRVYRWLVGTLIEHYEEHFLPT